MAELQYESHEPAPRVPTLRIVPDRVELVIPPRPLWLEIGGLAVDFAITSMALFLFGYGAWMMIRFRMRWGVPILAGESMGVFVLGVCLLLMEMAIGVAMLYDRCRTGPVPRVLETSGGTLHFSRRGLWGIRRQTYPVAGITGIQLKPIKGLSGKQVGASFVIRLGRWHRIHMRFGRKWLHLATEAERAFKEAAGL